MHTHSNASAVFQGVEFGGRRPELAEDHPRRLRAQELYPKVNAERAAWTDAWNRTIAR